MPNIWLLAIPASIAGVGMSMTFGFLLGYHFKVLLQLISRLEVQVNTHAHEDEEESAVVETTPNLIRQKQQTQQLDNGDSAIVVTKSPKEMRAYKDKQLQEELDRLGR